MLHDKMRAVHEAMLQEKMPAVQQIPLPRPRGHSRHLYYVQTVLLIMVYVCGTLSNFMEQVRLQKLTVTQVVMKFPALYGTRRFITVFTGPYPELDACGKL
jgi:hypothetical protein